MNRLLALTWYLLPAVPVSGSEAWWLEMDTRFHQALMKRFTDGDPAACRAVTDKLPELVESGKIKELEWVDSESETGGRHFPKGEVDYKIPGRTKTYQLKTGSRFSWKREKGKHGLEIRTPGTNTVSTLLVTTSAPLGKQWQPVFSIETDDVVRVLFGRDPESSAELWKAKALFTLKAAMPDDAILTWILGDGHPALAPPLATQTRKLDFGSLSETTSHFIGPAKSLRNLGTNFEWSLDPKQGAIFSCEAVWEAKGRSAVAKAFNSTGNLGEPGTTTKSPITWYVESVDSEGMHSHGTKKLSGEAVATLPLLP
jgi:hypothetical protein